VFYASAEKMDPGTRIVIYEHTLEHAEYHLTEVVDVEPNAIALPFPGPGRPLIAGLTARVVAGKLKGRLEFYYR
jgi:hypothetical protein